MGIVHVFVNESSNGPNDLANLEVYKNTKIEEIQSLFGITQRLISEHSEEMFSVNTIDSTSPSSNSQEYANLHHFGTG